MSKFNFSLQKILELREFEQSQAELELGKANAEITRIQNQLNALAVKKASLSKNRETASDVQLYTQITQYFVLLENKKEEYLEELAQAELIAEEKREIVRDAMKKVKVLEKLKETKLKEWKKEQEKIEAEEIDDLVSARFEVPE